MRFIVLVKATKDSEAGVMPTAAELSEMGAYNQQLIDAGVMLDGAGLQPTSKGARVCWDDSGKRTTVDGPFTETKELVAGYWLWECKSMAEAVEWANRCPRPHRSACHIEVRPMFDLADFPEVPDDVRKQAETAAAKQAKQ